jgi:hypothetical protein
MRGAISKQGTGVLYWTEILGTPTKRVYSPDFLRDGSGDRG